MHKMVKVVAKFINSEKKPIKGNSYKAKLYDNDLILDDLLGESQIDDEGTVNFLFDLNKAGSPDSLLETKPDLYVALYKDNSIIFESKIKKDSEFFKKDPVSNEKRVLTIDLGTFKI